MCDDIRQLPLGGCCHPPQNGAKCRLSFHKKCHYLWINILQGGGGQGPLRQALPSNRAWPQTMRQRPSAATTLWKLVCSTQKGKLEDSSTLTSKSKNTPLLLVSAFK
ncbi:Hypothetical predicted protein [Podarcis lilfordi]|uniref:Uncharacterized protein n=1 Tax=Podarcis lilfordi TaxID=74358 RepID=A0AA35KA55_9SAUR|nr:Hypothetical predicted protein [Podarcis lilfordi]